MCLLFIAIFPVYPKCLFYSILYVPNPRIPNYSKEGRNYHRAVLLYSNKYLLCVHIMSNNHHKSDFVDANSVFRRLIYPIMSSQEENNMNIISRQSDFGACGQLWLYPACAESSAPVLKSLDTYFIIFVCFYWSAPLFVAYAKGRQLFRTYLSYLQ